jgi:hypothetical protein
VIFSGAGLSMAAPSTVPAAATLAAQCAAAYEAMSGATLPADLHWNIEALADHFAERNQLQSIFLNSVIRQADLRSFFRNPNLGHEAIADFLGCGAIELNISTNVDDLTERSAELLGEAKANIAINRVEAVRPWSHKPHIKLHGCFRRDIADTLWCPRQLQTEPFQKRIREFREWLPGVLLERDLVFVGFWSDWAYLNNALEGVLNQTHAGRIVLVNPSDLDVLEGKAPGLWALAHEGTTEFVHERQSGADFLDELRQAFGAQFMKRLVTSGGHTFTAVTGRPVPPQPDFSTLSSRDLYEWRQDSTGVPAGHIVRKKIPDENMQVLGAMHLEMQNAGAKLQGAAYARSGRRTRLIHGAGQLISQVRARYAPFPSVIADDVVICVGAQDTASLPDNVARGNKTDSIVRPGLSGLWLTDAQAREHFLALEEVLGGDMPLAVQGED